MKDYYLEDFTEEQKIGQGSDGIVYSTGENKVIKFFRQSRKLRKEARINQDLQKNGLNVPKLYEGIELSFPEDHPLYNNGHRQFGLIMEKLDGELPGLLESKMRVNKKQEIKGYLDSIMDLGYFPRDTGASNNTLYLPDTGEIVFFDFARWLDFKPNPILKRKVLDSKTDPVKDPSYYSTY
jgi:hypothetical protein